MQTIAANQCFLLISATPKVENPQVFLCWKTLFEEFRSGSEVSDQSFLWNRCLQCSWNFPKHMIDFLRGPTAILFISRDTSSDTIAKLVRACSYGVSHNYRAICSRMAYRTDVPVKLSANGGYWTMSGEC